jgi:hypothetical protein
LDSSNNILACPESDLLVTEFLEDPFKEFQMTDSEITDLSVRFEKDVKMKSWGISDVLYKNDYNGWTHFEVFLSILEYYQSKIKPNAAWVLFKAERLIDLFSKIKKRDFPDLHVIYIAIIRDGRGVYCSQKNSINPDTDLAFSRSITRTSFYWKRFARKCMMMDNMKNYHIIRFEDLLQDPVKSLEHLDPGLELKKFRIEPGKGDLMGRLPDTHKIIHSHINALPMLHKLSEWQTLLSRDEVCFLERVFARELESFGYVRMWNRPCAFLAQIQYAVGWIAEKIRFIFRKVVFKIKH